MAAFIVIKVAMIRDGQSSRNRRSSVDTDSPSMMNRHLQQSLFLLIDIPLELISQNLFLAMLFQRQKFSLIHAISEISYQQTEFNLGSKEEKGTVLCRDSAAIGCLWTEIGQPLERRWAREGKDDLVRRDVRKEKVKTDK